MTFIFHVRYQVLSYVAQTKNKEKRHTAFIEQT